MAGDSGNFLQLKEVIFVESESGLEPFQTRLLLGDDYLRLDDGDDYGDFVLFDLKTHWIHSYNHEDRTHILVKPKIVEDITSDIHWYVERQELTDAPMLGGKIPIQHSFYANAQLCSQSMNAKGFLSEVSKVLIDYYRVLEDQNKQTVNHIPEAIKTDCYMANHYLFSTEYLKKGFPLYMVDYQGHEKKLLSYRDLEKPKIIMQHPENYSTYNPGTE